MLESKFWFQFIADIFDRGQPEQCCLNRCVTQARWPPVSSENRELLGLCPHSSQVSLLGQIWHQTDMAFTACLVQNGALVTFFIQFTQDILGRMGSFWHHHMHSWIAPPVESQKNNSPKKQKGYKNSRLCMKNCWQRGSRSAVSNFVWSIFDLHFQNNFPNSARTKIDTADLGSPCRILLCRGLWSFSGASVRSGIIFLGSYRKSSWCVFLDNWMLERTSDMYVCRLYKTPIFEKLLNFLSQTRHMLVMRVR